MKCRRLAAALGAILIIASFLAYRFLPRHIVARLSRLSLEWKATLPAKPNPECLTTESITAKAIAPKSAPQGVTPEIRAKAFARWDTNKDGSLTLDEYKAGLKGQDNLETRFNNFDKNGDGKLTREEFVQPTGK